MASIVGKKRGKATYYYLVESARVDGKPRIISQEYLETADELAAAMRGGGLGLPDRTRHKEFGAVATAWGMLEEVGVAGIIDQVTGPAPAGQPLSTGTYLALAALNRLVAPCSEAGFADWWKTTAGDRFTKIPAAALDHRRFWDAMHAVTPGQLEEISGMISVRIAQRGKAKQKRADLRIVGLGLVVTRDGGIPLTWHAYPGDRPDVTQFPAMVDQLKARYQAVCAASGTAADAADMTVVFDDGQNSEANFAHFAATGLHFIGSVPASDCPDLTALPASKRAVADKERFGGLTATLARGKTRRSRDKVEAEITSVISKPWVRRVVRWELTGDQPKDLRLTWSADEQAPAALEDEIFGKHALVTSHDGWPVPDVVAGYRSQPEAEFGFRQMKDTRVVSFSPMHHWTEHSILVHVFTCVLALQLAHLMRLRAARAGLRMSVRELLRELAGISETVLLYHGDRGRPRAHRMLTENSPAQDKLAGIFSLNRYAPRR